MLYRGETTLEQETGAGHISRTPASDSRHCSYVLIKRGARDEDLSPPLSTYSALIPVTFGEHDQAMRGALDGGGDGGTWRFSEGLISPAAGEGDREQW